MAPVFKRVLVTFIWLVGGLSSVMAAPLPPDQLVKQTIDEVLVIIRSDEQVKSGDVARIAEVMEEKIAPHFDFPENDKTCCWSSMEGGDTGAAPGARKRVP